MKNDNLSPNKVIVIDVDDTILKTENRNYKESKPINEVIHAIQELKKNNWKIILHTSRGMGRSNGNISLVAEEVKKEITEFCLKYKVPFDELILGKPWAIAYVDDKAMRPDEFSKNFHKLMDS